MERKGGGDSSRGGGVDWTPAVGLNLWILFWLQLQRVRKGIERENLEVYIVLNDLFTLLSFNFGCLATGNIWALFCSWAFIYI